MWGYSSKAIIPIALHSTVPWEEDRVELQGVPCWECRRTPENILNLECAHEHWPTWEFLQRKTKVTKVT